MIYHAPIRSNNHPFSATFRVPTISVCSAIFCAEFIPSKAINFKQGLEKEELKAFQIELILKKLVTHELPIISVEPLPKEPLEIVFPKVVIDDVIVYQQEQLSPSTFTIRDEQYYMNTPSNLLNPKSPG